MPVMQVRGGAVGGGRRNVVVGVHVRFAGRVGRGVGVAVMAVVDVPVAVDERFVAVFVPVTLGELQRHPHRHQ